MSTYQVAGVGNFRNEGWGLAGSGVNSVCDAWSTIGDDTHYTSCPANKGRAAIVFQQDIADPSIPNGATIESVEVWVRAAKTDSAARSVTINLLPSDCTGNFTSRTISLTQTPFNYLVGTYTRDPRNRPWTRETLNHIVVQAFSYCGVADKVRVYEAFIVVNFRNRPTVTITAPTGTVDSAAPVVAWTYVQPDGDIQKFAEYKLYTAAQQEHPAFNPDTSPASFAYPHGYQTRAGDTLAKLAARKLGDASLWPSIFQISGIEFHGADAALPVGTLLYIPSSSTIQGDTTSFTLPFALPRDSYYIYVRATSTRGARSTWSDGAFTVSGAAPGAPGGSLGGVGTGGGGGFESVIADQQTSNVFLSVRDGSNLLSVQQSDFETPTDSLGFTGNGCDISQDLTTCYGPGAGSLKLKTNAAGVSGSASTAITGLIECEEAAPMTVRAQFRAAATSRTVTIAMTFIDIDGEIISGLQESDTDSTTTWTEVVCTGESPAGTKYVQAVASVASPVLNEVHNVDAIGVMYGTDSAWSNGGHASRNMLTSSQSGADDPVASEPFVAANIASAYARPTISTTFASGATSADGMKAFQMTYNGITPSLTYVATGTAFTDTSTGSGYTLNKPAGVANGDVLVAYVASNTGVVVTPPVGWSVISTCTQGSTALSVLMRDGLAADPSTWVGTISDPASTRKRAIVIAYRGAAPVAQQLAGRTVSTQISGDTLQEVGPVWNSDPGAFRLSAFAVTAGTSGGTMTANVTPTAAFPPIQFVGTAGAWKYAATATPITTFTINRPSGVVAGDLMIAQVAVAGTCTFTAPTGWTMVNSITEGSTGYPDTGTVSMAVFKRTVGTIGSEPTSWSDGSHTITHLPSNWDASGVPYTKMSQVVAYRNVADASAQFIDDGIDGTVGAAASTGMATNTDSNAWRVSFFANVTTGGSSMTSNEVSRRYDGATFGLDPAPNISMYDSNGPVSTGVHQRHATTDTGAYVWGAAGWVGIIAPATGTPPTLANETERQDATTGASGPYVTLAAYDAAAGVGSFAVYGTFTPGSGTSTTSGAAWMGYLSPLAATVDGEVACTLVDFVDISHVSPDVLARSGNQVTVQASFVGSTAGVPHLKLYSYTGVELISTQTAECDPFNEDIWTKAVTTFTLPDGATRFKMGVSAIDRQVGDIVLFDRVSIAFGADDAYHPGTGRDAHPIFNAPLIEYAEDLGTGYGDWQPLAYTIGVAPKYDNVTGICNVIDQTMVPLSSRKYRSRTISYGLAGDSFMSPYGPESREVQLVAGEWWIKDLTVPDLSMKLKVFADPLKVTKTDTSVLFQPLGSDRPMILSQGYKGDIISLTIQVRSEDFVLLQQVFDQGHTVFLQSNLDKAWWVRPYGDIDSTVQLTGDMHTDPLRFVAVQFAEVDSEV